jgi:hypothetical protein
LRVTFGALAEGGTGLYAYSWTFGDGASASEANPVHEFVAEGSYAPAVRVVSGAESATCSKAVTAQPPQSPTFNLLVVPQGSGTGTVTSSPAGIDCGATCTADYARNTTVSLSARADTGSVFMGWAGGCAGTGACSVTMDAARQVMARFERTSFTLRVTKTPLGPILGSVSSSPAGINCGSLCANASASYPAGTVVTLNASAILTALFQGWGGACSGTGACVVTMNSDLDVTANFGLLGLNAPGTGAPTPGVTSLPASGLALRSLITTPGARADVTFDGRPVLAGVMGDASVRVDAVAGGAVLVEGWLRDGTGPGTWRLEFGAGPLPPGALGVVAGDAVQVTPASVTFRLKGRPGERVALLLRLVDSSSP